MTSPHHVGGSSIGHRKWPSSRRLAPRSAPVRFRSGFVEHPGADTELTQLRAGCRLALDQPRNGKGDAYAYCKACRPGAVELRWTPGNVLAAMRAWRARYGRLPSSYDWSRTHAIHRGGPALERLSAGPPR